MTVTLVKANSSRLLFFMKNGEVEYLNIIKIILENGELTPNRTGVSALTVPHMMLQHDMSFGFPLLTTKKMAWKSIRVELEGFIKGIHDKQWFQERGCNIWDEWCNPKKIPAHLNGDEKKAFQLQEPELGPIYGVLWRGWGGLIDQLTNIVNTLKTNPHDRRMVCSAWDPSLLDQQALPPCHYSWQVMVTKGKLHLCWTQRSVDILLGLPFNVASYGLLLHLLCKETGYEPGILTGFLMNCHIYENHIKGAKQQLQRIPYPLPTIETPEFTSIFDWNYKQTKVINYQSHDKITFEVAV